MSMTLDENIKRWTTTRKRALVIRAARGERLRGKSFNYWDEACWLIGASAIRHVFLTGSG